MKDNIHLQDINIQMSVLKDRLVLHHFFYCSNNYKKLTKSVSVFSSVFLCVFNGIMATLDLEYVSLYLSITMCRVFVSVCVFSNGIIATLDSYVHVL